VTVFDYHDRTFHHLDRFARSLGHLDFATMPSPFRAYRHAPLLELPREHPDAWPPVAFDDLYFPGAVPAQRVDVRSIGSFLRYAMGLSAWKEAGHERWPLRVNPSSGNLHPTEAYVVSGAVEGVNDSPGVYHYRADLHALETRCRLESEATIPGAFLVGLASIHWREAWKYGERAYRYCQHDVGHAIAALAFSASLLGWDLAVLPGWSDVAVAALLGIDRPAPDGESEDADCLVLVSPGPLDRDRLPAESSALVASAREAEWLGTPSRLSEGHVAWPVIDEVARAATKPPGATALPRPEWPPTRRPMPPRTLDARTLILGRRSALDFDPAFTLGRADFVRMLERLLPQASAPWNALAWPPLVHLAVFVHRVEGVAPGLYALPRSSRALIELRAAARPEFQWRPAAGLPDDLPLFLLLEGDARSAAARISCDQSIAGDSCFSLGMVAKFEEPIATFGSWFYRRLFWEAGTVGQVLYLEAEAAGVRGTGIGCYFDPAMHDLMGFESQAFRSLYHFTVGRPIEDHRLLTRPGYDWEQLPRSTSR
jgi:SagB-type dehydrogenase family enzyme